MERAAALVAVGGLVFKMQHWPFGGIILVVSLGTLSVIYFFTAQKTPPETETKLGMFAHKLMYWGLSITTIAILFKLQHWPNANFFMFIGSMTLVGVTLLCLRMQIKINLVRIGIVLAAAAFLFFNSGANLVKMGIHRDMQRDTVQSR